jgi:hypothetical protein
MRKFTIAAAMLAATFCSGSAFAVTGGYEYGVRPSSDIVKVGGYCHRAGCSCCGCCLCGCCVRTGKAGGIFGDK